MKHIVHVDIRDSVRRRQQTEALEAEKAFWMKAAEELWDVLDKIFSAAENEGKVRIIQRGRMIDLVVAPPEDEHQ